MNKKIIFAAGAGLLVGSTVTLLILRKYYVKIITSLVDQLNSANEELEDSEREIKNLVTGFKEAISENSDKKPPYGTDYSSIYKAAESHNGVKPDINELRLKTEEELESEDDEYDPDEEYDPYDEIDLINLYGEIEEDDNDLDSLFDDKYLIKEDEYGELEDYEQIRLIMYSDGEIADSHGHLLDSIDDTLGQINVNDASEEPIFWVRDDARRIDYEVSKSVEKYSEAIKKSPFKATADMYADL